MSIHIRPATVADTESLIPLVAESDLYQKRELEREAINEQVVVESKARWVREILTKSDWQYLVAEDKEIIGYILVERNEAYPGSGSVNDLFVQPAHRRKGVAQQLITVGLEWLRAAGVKEVTIAVHSRNKAALSLYRAVGFQPQKDEYRYLARSL